MSDERRKSDDRRYAVLSRECIKHCAEASGYELREDVAALLAEDTVYHLREIVQSSCHFMKHARRKILTADDINCALKNSDSQPVCGYGSQEPLPFRQTREGELYFVNDLDINLGNIACSNHVPPPLKGTLLKATWLAVNGSSVEQTATKENQVSPQTVSDDLMQYYEHVTKAILCHDEELVKMALRDLQSNPNISPLLPCLVNFISNGVKTVNHDIYQLTKLLHIVNSLISNKTLYLEPKPFLDMLFEAVMTCVIEPLSINPLSDHWTLRDYAARLLVQITHKWNNKQTPLEQQTLTTFQEVLYDLTRPLCSLYGAVMGLATIGTQALEDVLVPTVDPFVAHLQTALEDTTVANAQAKDDAQKVYGALQMALELVLESKRKDAWIVASQTDVPSGEALPGSPGMLNKKPASAALDTTSGGPRDGATDPSAKVTGVKEEASSAQETRPEVPCTSTPIKAEVQLADPGGDGDLIGPVLTLPETTSPTRQLADLYGKMYSWFGDGLSTRLPVAASVPGFYQTQTAPVEVSLADKYTDQSGEELLKQFLVPDEPGIRGSRSHKDENETRSDNYESMLADDLDFDMDADEKSSRSERSSRSSRSDRSHSEDLSFLGEDTDLTVKATVSDPSLGIKLTISKRPKPKLASPGRPSSDMADADDNGSGQGVSPRKDNAAKVSASPHDAKLDSLPQKTPPSAKARPAKAEAEPFFEKVPYREQETAFVFRFLGHEQVYKTQRNRIRSTHSIVYPSLGARVPSEMCQLTRSLKTIKHLHFKSQPGSLRKRRRKLHRYMANLGTFL